MLTKERILFILCAVFFTSFFLPVFIALKVISMSLLAAFCIAYPFVLPKTPITIPRSYLYLVGAFSVWMILSVMWSENHKDSTHFLTLRLPIIILPCAFAMVSVSTKLRDQILLAFAWIVVIATSFSALSAVTHALAEHNPDRFYNDYLSMAINQQSIYTSALVNIAIYIFAASLFKTANNIHRLMYSAALIVLLVISFLLASRNMMAILYLSIVLAVGYLVISRKRYLVGISLLSGVVILVFVVFTYFPKTLNRFRELRFTNYSLSTEAGEAHYSGNLSAGQWNGANFRLAAWSCGWEVFKQEPIVGVGIGDKRDALYSVYKERDFKFGLRSKKNVHNNYLDILLSLGVIGLVLFVTGWLLAPMAIFFSSRDYLALLITITLGAAMITETYFDRSLGGLVVGLFIPLLMLGHRKKEKARYRRHL